MKHYTIKNHQTGSIIHQGLYKSFKDCIEHAVQQNIKLDHADLRYRNLSCANIDTAQLYNARLDFCNLNNANISEAILEQCNFTGASFIGTCLAESQISNSTFINASFGATDLSATNMNECIFSTLSALQLPFQDLANMRNCYFKNAVDQHTPLSRPPLIISGVFKAPIAILDKTILIGHRVVPMEILNSHYTKKFIQSKIAKIAGFS
jgi:2-iminobutanoate/2-iminopropanoate deaminase